MKSAEITALSVADNGFCRHQQLISGLMVASHSSTTTETVEKLMIGTSCSLVLTLQRSTRAMLKKHFEVIRPSSAGPPASFYWIMSGKHLRFMSRWLFHFPRNSLWSQVLQAFLRHHSLLPLNPAVFLQQSSSSLSFFQSPLISVPWVIFSLTAS